ncbi:MULTISPECIES: CDP-diacylglycerol--serine O-phosphatidyltransferase [Bacillus]|uniref:CDP-diacylglycerol--serine O-phosphatidyltransferase n=1 Tax=Bacillus TaxID=1386 RepID=UPI000D41F1BC|nr:MULTISPECIES: CDP-diacylglycerol--serine O-phosphatidyltransferase [Bacillus]MCU5311022.1 CDP-diacylglycerol--serine O-phosphatidyltransferase [Bacillus cereus]PRP91610.1 CDP-diacylglycerol--glycerol-3-phosphate 3-phosphatidyltransferase [Bacillus sp. M21]HDR4604076.1 CDP-diacylglycerol--serine O-phosphatidyltransferase [Bacillus cereus]HDR4606754.1 CDP-diacylglycerol--serine O-phosphatidyltransferase [Bacillus cereus]HDR4632526.1 CDP-diacylglycerol--serine O-phosphatidyltransferase [Bacill
MSKNLNEVMSRKEEKRVMSYIPNMMTIANFICGILAIYSVFFQDMYGAVMFIITGMVFDLFDGMVARKLDAVSEIGGELDSFADLVTFGVAPSILAYSVALKDLQSIGMLCALAYSVCGMLRLARFNTQQGKLPTFIGMPIPFAAICLLILCLLNNPVSVAFGTCILAYLMVSKIKFPHFKKDISESLKSERWN